MYVVFDASFSLPFQVYEEEMKNGWGGVESLMWSTGKYVAYGRLDWNLILKAQSS